ncbi:dTDP-4-amino-4,6-dideoxygalactose transaminase [Paenibacillus wulumuqiensis]|uniref:dTDP-4-amino-4,6-dideoxygalactose transaminase n=1 Tax=Paenibacillus wulumuqiensis TaxID=1567107 RepID=UPI00061952D9|nr:dTDP-4-amino-4,6-dideoxygalactose transaminase [Paenibacillus wulumuqiensis]
MNNIPFNFPAYTEMEYEYIKDAFQRGHLSGDGEYTKKCSALLEAYTATSRVLLTTSCTHALEMGALLADIQEGDEVIMPSYTFVSTANAFVLRGAFIKFVDIRPDTMNMDEEQIEQAVTERTRVIVPVHYAGVSCEMDRINELALHYKVMIIEDAAQGISASYKGRALGSIGQLGCFSFHETKNVHCGEGGALLVNNPSLIQNAEIIREKGTDRSRFFRGQVDKYSWVDKGSSYLLSDLNAAFLYSQLENVENIKKRRIELWNTYYHQLLKLAHKELIQLPHVPSECDHNAHMFYIKLKNLEQRVQFINYMKEHNIMSVFHYVPLHTSLAGKKFSRFIGEDRYTTKESERLVRLPLFYNMTNEQQEYIISVIYNYFS